MRRILLTLIVSTLLSSPAWAWGTVMISGGVEAGSGYTEEFYFGGAETDTKDGLTAHRATKVDGTLGNSASIVASGSDPGTASADGGNCLKLPAWSSYITWPVTAGDVFNSAAGLIEVEFYGPCSSAARFIAISGTGFLFITVENGGTVTFRFWDGTREFEAVTSTDTVAPNTWTKIYVRWSTTTHTQGVKVGSGSWKDEAMASNVTAFGAEPTVIGIGDTDSGVQNNTYVDGLKIWTTYTGT